MSRTVTIAVCGAGTTDFAASDRAELVGRTIGICGARLVCGGLGGVMAAACRGAKEAGGLTIGILPGKQKTEANQWVDIPIATGLAEGRNLLIIYSADGIIALPGGPGTLSEIAFALKIGRPILDLGGWGLKGMITGAADPAVAATDFIRHLQESER